VVEDQEGGLCALIIPVDSNLDAVASDPPARIGHLDRKLDRLLDNVGDRNIGEAYARHKRSQNSPSASHASSPTNCV